MRKLPRISARNALVIFVILTIVFSAQMLWWIIFQVRNAEHTKNFMAATVENERRSTISLLNSHYRAIYDLTLQVMRESDGELPLGIIGDPAVSGFTVIDSAARINEKDSLYLVVSFDDRKLLLLLNPSYPASIIGQNPHLEFRLPIRRELIAPDWLNNETVTIKSGTYAQIEKEKQKHLKMFIMEGSFFILLILIGAYMIYAALKKIKQVREEQLLFVHSITHELKIPITSLNLFLDTLKRRHFDPGLAADLMPKMKEDLTRLNQLIDNVLQVRKLSDKTVQPISEVIDLSEELKRFAAIIEERIRSAGGKINLNIGDDIRINGDPQDLVRVWETLIDNSLKYSSEKPPELTIILKNHKDNVAIEFLDNGTGIQEGMEEKLFEPFFRGNAPSKKSIPGSGLGLYIAREMVKRNGGTIAVKNAPGGGCMAVMKFKAAE